jgi:8-oxo-dGTP pyrophosphatase MutT (NUDIX family)
MVVRPDADEIAVFMVRRHPASNFAADVYAFPGGTVRADDRLSEADARAIGLNPAELHALLAERDDPFSRQDDGGQSLWVAALRELFEEAGVLLADDEAGQPLDLADPQRASRFQSLRRALQQGGLSLAELARAERLHLTPERLAYFSRWITPPSSPRRFDARFFVAELPGGQTADHCQIETVDGVWVSPRSALDSSQASEFPMLLVTREHVRRLSEFTTTAGLLDYTRQKSIRAVQPATDDEAEIYRAAAQRGWW